MAAASNPQSEIPNPKSPRRWFRFSLGTLFIVLTIACLGLGWFVNRAQRQQRAVAMIESMGVVRYKYELGADGDRMLCYPPAPGPDWLRKRIGIDYFDDVIKIDLEARDDCEPATDAHLAALAHLHKLRGLSLSGAPISDKGCRHLATLTALENLDLSDTQISDGGLAHLAGHKRLRKLFLAGTNVHDEGIVRLATLPQLKYLALQRTQLADQGLQALAQLPLELLEIGETRVTDAGLAHLRNHPTLDTIQVSNTAVGNAGARHLATIPQLAVLRLDNTRITDDCLADLARCPKLRMVCLGGNHLSPAAVARFEQALPECVVFRE